MKGILTTTFLVLLFGATDLYAQLLGKVYPFEVRLGLNHSNLNKFDEFKWMGANASFLLIYPIKRQKFKLVTGFDFQLVKHEEIEKLPPRQERSILLKNKQLVSIPAMIRYPIFKSKAYLEGGVMLDLIGVGGQVGIGFKLPVRGGDFLTISAHQQYSLIPHWKQKRSGLEVSGDAMISKIMLGIMVVEKKKVALKKKQGRSRTTH